jgi:hypothetical protein
MRLDSDGDEVEPFFVLTAGEGMKGAEVIDIVECTGWVDRGIIPEIEGGVCCGWGEAEVCCDCEEWDGDLCWETLECVSLSKLLRGDCIDLPQMVRQLPRCRRV